MKILLLFSFRISLQDWVTSGIFDREVKLYQELIRRYPVQAKFLTYGGEKDQDYCLDLDGISILPVYKRQPDHPVKLACALRTLLLPWTFGEELRTLDLYKTNQMMGAWVGVIGKLRFRKPLLVRCGYELSEFLRFARANWWLRFGGWVASFVTYHVADRIHVATQKDKEIVRRRFLVSSRKIYVHPNWVDTATFCPPPKDKKRRHNVLFVGRLTDQKNLPLLVDAMSGTDLGLTIVGAGELEKELQKRIDKHRIVVNLRSNIPNSSMPDLYRECKIYVICSHYEGNPKTLLEAMACGCAVIGTNVPGIREIISHEKNGILVSENHEELRAAICRLKDDDKLRQAIGEAAHELILREHSLHAAVEAEWCAYNALTKLNET